MYHVFYEDDAAKVIKDLGMLKELPTGKKLRDLWFHNDPELEGANLIADQDDESWIVREEDGDPFWDEL